jgi:indole-3-glycerol phosphate synthase
MGQSDLRDYSGRRRTCARRLNAARRAERNAKALFVLKKAGLPGHIDRSAPRLSSRQGEGSPARCYTGGEIDRERRRATRPPHCGVERSGALACRTSRKIGAYKREEIAAAKRARLSLPEKDAKAAAAPRGFLRAIEKRISGDNYALIAEIKKAILRRG